MEEVKVIIEADLKISCYNCNMCIGTPKKDTEGNDGVYSCSATGNTIGGYHGDEHYSSQCNGLHWEWDQDDRGQKTLEDCNSDSMKVVSIKNFTFS